MTKIAKVLSANVPRYTSYPTAPHFHPGVDDLIYRDWLAALPTSEPLSLYFHIPFCNTLCWFCACHTNAVNNYKPVQDYCRFLHMELAAGAAAMKERHSVSHIHLGGGSPTMLAADDIIHLGAAIRKEFDVLPDAEIGVEIDPRGLDQAKANAFKEFGVTRASIGLQDCDPQVQKAINRIQTDGETREAMHRLRQAGIKSLNLDIVYGLPGQTLKSWERTLEFAVHLAPDRLSVFGYAHVPQFKKHQALISSERLPGIDERFFLAEFARSFLCSHGYLAIGLDHFARPQDALAQASGMHALHRNFQGYTTDSAKTLLGFGASAIGSLPQGYAQNFSSVRSYRAALEMGHLPIARGLEISETDRMRRETIEALMCEMAVDLDKIASRYGKTRAAFSDALPTLHELAREGILALEGGKIEIDPQWRPAVRTVCAAFDQYLIPDRHSLAV